MPVECIKGVTLLSKEEAENLLTREERVCKGTQKAKNNGLYVTSGRKGIYWLRSAGPYTNCVCSVYVNGVTGTYCTVSSANVGIRPALIVNLQSSNLGVGDTFEFGGYTFKIISNDLALCDVIIDVCPFNQNIEDGNNYETSYVKKRVD